MSKKKPSDILIDALERIRGNDPEENRQHADCIAHDALFRYECATKKLPKHNAQINGVEVFIPPCPKRFKPFLVEQLEAYSTGLMKQIIEDRDFLKRGKNIPVVDRKSIQKKIDTNDRLIDELHQAIFHKKGWPMRRECFKGFK